MHLNVDCAVGGTDEQLARAIGGSGELPPEEKVSEGGYGRIFSVPAQSFAQLCAHLRAELHTQRLFAYGDGADTVDKAASFCGAGAGRGCPVARGAAGGRAGASFRRTQTQHSSDALECGLKVVQLTHYASENYGFKILYKKLCGGLGVPCEYHEDEFLL